MNPISFFKEVVRRAGTEDVMRETRDAARRDAERMRADATAQFEGVQNENWLRQRAVYEGGLRRDLEEMQQIGAFERSALNEAGEAARHEDTQRTAVGNALRSHEDNLRQLKTVEEVDEYLKTHNVPQLRASHVARIAAETKVKADEATAKLIAAAKEESALRALQKQNPGIVNQPGFQVQLANVRAAAARYRALQDQIKAGLGLRQRLTPGQIQTLRREIANRRAKLADSKLSADERKAQEDRIEQIEREMLSQGGSGGAMGGPAMGGAALDPVTAAAIAALNKAFEPDEIP